MQVSEKCAYYKDNQKISYAQKFYYYLNNNHEELEKICFNFHSTNQIKTWISNTLNNMYDDIELREVTQVSQSFQVPLSPSKYETLNLSEILSLVLNKIET
jgi:hypothetical protein